MVDAPRKGVEYSIWTQTEPGRSAKSCPEPGAKRSSMTEATGSADEPGSRSRRRFTPRPLPPPAPPDVPGCWWHGRTQRSTRRRSLARYRPQQQTGHLDHDAGTQAVVRPRAAPTVPRDSGARRAGAPPSRKPQLPRSVMRGLWGVRRVRHSAGDQSAKKLSSQDGE
jgi:hypothetical protein